MKSILKSIAAIAIACALGCAARAETWDVNFNVSASASTSLSVIPISYGDCGYTPLMLVTATVTKTIRIPIKAGRVYSVKYKNIYGAQLTPPSPSYSNFTAQGDGEFVPTQTLTVTWLACYNPHIPPADAAAYVASHGIDVAEVKEMATVVTSKDLNGDGKSDKYIATNILDNIQNLSNGDRTGYMRIPSSFGTVSQDNLVVNVRGRFVTLKELAEQMGKAVSDILNIQIAGGRFDITIKQVAVNAITSSVYQWALRQLNMPDSTPKLLVGFASQADPFVPLYKPAYDPDRRRFLGRLQWSEIALGTGKLRFVSVANTNKIKIYTSPDKKASPINWGDTLDASLPGAVRDFYVEGLQTSGSLEDVRFRIEYVADETTTTVSQPEPAKMTVYALSFVTPGGDPLNSPVDGGNGTGTVTDGANEFTYSNATTGVVQFPIKVKTVPSIPSPSSIASGVSFDVPKIGNIDPVWNSANPSGQASLDQDFIVAKAVYTGLPDSNAGFGSKAIKLRLHGKDVETKHLEVFYQKTASNHPGGQIGSRNWFHYWKEALSFANGVVYNNAIPPPPGGGLPYGVTPAMAFWHQNWPNAVHNKQEVWIADLSAETMVRLDGSNQLTTGIDCFANVVRHESKHVAQIVYHDGIVGVSSGTIWSFGWSWQVSPRNHWTLGPDGRAGVANVDDDGNGMVDDRNVWLGEVGKAGSDDVNRDSNNDDVANGLSYANVEVDAVTAETIAEHTYWLLDWGNPGKQHGTIRKYND